MLVNIIDLQIRIYDINVYVNHMGKHNRIRNMMESIYNIDIPSRLLNDISI